MLIDRTTLNDGPFLRPQRIGRRNLGILVLLGPLLMAATWFFDAALWPCLMAASLAGTLTAAADRRQAAIDLDWAVAASITALFMPMTVSGNTTIGLAAGFVGGLASGWRKTAGLNGYPGLITLITLAFLHISSLSSNSGIGTDTLPFISWPSFFALMSAGMLIGARLTEPRYWAVPWIFFAGLALGETVVPASSSSAMQGLVFSGLNFMVLPLLLVAPYIARSKLEVLIYWGFMTPWPVLFMPENSRFGLFAAMSVLVFLPRLLMDGWAGAVSAPRQEKNGRGRGKAFLKCAHNGTAGRLAVWTGLPSCRLAAAHDGGGLVCTYGCLGLGDCAKACRYGAITINDDGFPVVDHKLCRGCGECVAACPKDLFEISDQVSSAFIPCASKSSLKKNAAYCGHSCLGCGKCRKACSAGAIARDGAQGALAVDRLKCLAYGPSCGQICAAVCPRRLVMVTEAANGS